MKRGKILFLVMAFVAAAGFLSAQASNPYKLYNQYRAAAKAGKPYPGAPLKGKVIEVFANIFATLPFCIDVENTSKHSSSSRAETLDTGWISMDNNSTRSPA